jgi:transcriptional regulator with XRE-family HTH domain
MKSTPAVLLSVKAGLMAAGLGQAEFAAGLGISRTALTNRFIGRTRLTLDDLDKFAEIFGVDRQDLLDGPGEWLKHIDGQAVRVRVDARVRAGNHKAAGERSKTTEDVDHGEWIGQAAGI